MTTQDSLPDPVDRASPQCHDPSHAHLTEQKDQVYRLIHQGMDATDQGLLEDAQAIFAQALTLSRTHALPQWEAQALFSHGVTLDRAGHSVEAIPWFEQALALFREHGPIRMELTVSIFLANMLTKTGDPERSLPLLQQAKAQANSGLETGVLPPDEHEYELYGLYRELGRVYLEVGQWRLAQQIYQQALQLDPLYAGAQETSALYQDILVLHVQQGDLNEALTTGSHLLDTLDASSAHDLQILANVAFQLGLLCLQTHRSRRAIRYSQLAFQHTQQQRVKKTHRAFPPETVAFLGRTCVNIGSGYGGIASSLSHYATTLAYWRCGEDLLNQVEAEDVVVPRDNIAGPKRICIQQMGSKVFEQVWQESLPLYQEIQAALVAPDEERGPLLAELLQVVSSPPQSKPRPTSRSHTRTRKRRE